MFVVNKPNVKLNIFENLQHALFYKVFNRSLFDVFNQTEYIGETGRRLGDRIRDHLYDAQTISLNLSCYFNFSYHSITNYVAFGLSIL